MASAEQSLDGNDHAEDPLVRRLEHLGWGEAPAEVRARCWRAFSTLVPKPNPQPPPMPALSSPRIPRMRDHGTVERHNFTRQTRSGHLSVAQLWARRPVAAGAVR